MTAKTILTGVKPTGAPHIGNYIGAIRPALALAKAHEKSYLFIADYHALNAVHDPKALVEDSYQVAATWLACGLDPAKTVFYRQSDVPEIFELTSLLTSVTPKGLMDRSHAYKAAVDKNREAKRDADADVNMGLYTYPILMAADILAPAADIVPVGKDQVQHVEFARDMAGYFNNTYTNVFKLPTHQLEKSGAVLPGIDGRKMSKSYGNHIPLFMDANARRKLVMKITTDSKRPEESKNPDENIIFQIYSHVASESQIKEMRDAFEKGGMGYGDAKKRLADALDLAFEEPTAIYNSYMADREKIDALLEEGAKKARMIARETLKKARIAVGLDTIASNRSPVNIDRIEVYLEQIETYASKALSAIQRFSALNNKMSADLESSAMPEIKVNHLFDELDLFVSNTAMVSKTLWPLSRTPFARKRGETLRKILKVSDSSPIRSRSLRDSIEHFDERLDNWTQHQTSNGSLAQYVMGPNLTQMFGGGIPLSSIFSGLDTQTGTYVLMGEEYVIQPMVNGVMELLNEVKKCLEVHQPWRRNRKF
jgi:tryptophanyl-tRNA synthetase